MAEGGKWGPQGLEDFDVFGGIHDVVLASEHMSDAHFDVVDDVDEVEDVAAVGPAEGGVIFLTAVDADGADDLVVEADAFFG